MAKELPYFKFEPNQWDNGAIQMFSREEKGLFIDLCAMYWSRIGDLPFKLAVQKLCGGNATALNSLCEENIFAVIDGMISISFLNEQLQEFDDLSNRNKKNAIEGWEKRRNNKALSDRNATASSSHMIRNAIREDKKREDNRRKENKVTNVTSVEKIDWMKLLELFNSIFGKKCTVVSEAVRRKYNRRLKDGYTKDQIRDAMVNASRDQFHKDSGYKHCTLDFFSRSEMIDKWANVKQQHKSQTPYNPRA